MSHSRKMAAQVDCRALAHGRGMLGSVRNGPRRGHGVGPGQLAPQCRKDVFDASQSPFELTLGNGASIFIFDKKVIQLGATRERQAIIKDEQHELEHGPLVSLFGRRQDPRLDVGVEAQRTRRH